MGGSSSRCGPYSSGVTKPESPDRGSGTEPDRFGVLAWGGPVAQIAMLRRELVDEERWVSSQRFNRTLAVYQVLPGPEAHELCVYFGMLSRGHIGGMLAGLGFMLPGFLLMLALSWFYMSVGIESPAFQALFAGSQAAVVALIVRAVHRIGDHALHDRWLLGIGMLALVASILGVHFLVTLLVAGAAYGLVARGFRAPALALMALFLAGSVVYGVAVQGSHDVLQGAIGGANVPESARSASASGGELLGSGLRAGLLTFGGAYTAIPFVQHDAVVSGGWMTNRQFLDGLALSGILPAPLIIFSTFVGYVAGGPLGSLAMTVGIFAPAFGFTLLGHRYLERLIANRAVHAFLDGVTAGVVGLIAATTLALFPVAIRSLPALLIFGAALAALYACNARTAVALIVIGSGVVGLLLFGILGVPR
jgi:chromate transporter